MNKAFSKHNPIILDETFRLEDDGFNGIVLIEKTRIVHGAKSKTPGKEVDHEDKHYFPCVAQALRKFLIVSQKNSESIEDIVRKTDYAFEAISRIEKEFKQY